MGYKKVNPKVKVRKVAENRPKVGFNSNRKIERSGELVQVLAQIARHLYLEWLLGCLRWLRAPTR